jgi:hypothetical protein
MMPFLVAGLLTSFGLPVSRIAKSLKQSSTVQNGVWIDYAHFNSGWLIHAVVYLVALYENVLSNCSNYALWDPHLCLHENLV